MIKLIISKNIKGAEEKMVDLMKNAIFFYKNELDFKLAKFYYEYGSLLLEKIE